MNIYGDFEVAEVKETSFEMESDGRNWPHFRGTFVLRHKPSGLSYTCPYMCGLGIAFPYEGVPPFDLKKKGMKRVYEETAKHVTRGFISIWLKSRLEELAPHFRPHVSRILEAVASDAMLYHYHGEDLDDFASSLGIERPSRAVEAFNSCRDAWDFLTRCGLCLEHIQAIDRGDVRAVDN